MSEGCFKELETLDVSTILANPVSYQQFKDVFKAFPEFHHLPSPHPTINYNSKPTRLMNIPARNVYEMVHDNSFKIGEKMNQLLNVALQLSFLMTPGPYLDGNANAKARGDEICGDAAAFVAIVMGHNSDLEAFALKPECPKPNSLIQKSPANYRYGVYFPTFQHPNVPCVAAKRQQVLSMFQKLTGPLGKELTAQKNANQPPVTTEVTSPLVVVSSAKRDVIEHLTGGSYKAQWDVIPTTEAVDVDADDSTKASPGSAAKRGRVSGSTKSGTKAARQKTESS